jgi:hypothetical protein
LNLSDGVKIVAASAQEIYEYVEGYIALDLKAAVAVEEWR